MKKASLSNSHASEKVMTMNFDFSGLDDLIAEIDKIEGLTEELKDQALISGGDYLRDRMEEEVYSHGLTERSGEAQESITRTDPDGGTLFVGTEGGKRQPGFYLYMHEFGYYNVQAGRFIAPKPMASVVYEQNKSAIMDKYVSVFKKGMGL